VGTLFIDKLNVQGGDCAFCAVVELSFSLPKDAGTVRVLCGQGFFKVVNGWLYDH
jgi:xanthine/CO dehydrogenase XdhC/CoxF family maturation factor